MPGNYKVSLSKFEDGKLTEIVSAQPFTVKSLNAASLPATDKQALTAFSKKVSELRRATGAADSYKDELNTKIKFIKQAVIASSAAMPGVTEQLVCA
jgi:hypothetical protein